MTVATATNRLVVTYMDPWPTGFLTGYEADGGVVLEHMVACKPGVLLPMLREGIEEGRRRGYDHIRLRLPQAYPDTTRLRLLALRMGFRRYHEDEEWLDYVKYL